MIETTYTLTDKELYKITLIQYFMKRENKYMTLAGSFFIICSIFSEKIGYRMGILGAVMFLMPLIQIYWTRRMLKSTPNIGDEVMVSISEENIHFGENENSSTLTWESISHYKMTKDYIFLGLNDLQSLSIPTRAFTESELNEVIQILRIKKTHKAKL